MQRSNEFTVRDMLFILKKRIVLICTITIIAVLMSFFYTRCLVQPVYKCVTTLIVSVEQNGEVKTSAQIADTFGYILKNQSLLNKVIEKLDMNISAGELATHIDFSETNSTGIYELTATAGEYYLTGAITDAVIEYVPDEIKNTFKTGSVDIIILYRDIVQNTPNIVNNTVAGFVIGFALSSVLSFIIEMMNNRYRTTEDIKNKLKYPVIGIIPKASASKNALHGNGINSELTESFNALQTVLRYTAKKRPAKKIIIISPQAGEGKTTVTLNLGAALAAAGRKTLVVDTDFKTSGISGLLSADESDQKGLSSVLTKAADVSDCILNSFGFDLLPSGPAPDNTNEIFQSEAMSAFLIDADKRYDTILFDTPPLTQYSDAIALLPRMDGAILVIRHNYTSFESAIFAKERFEMVSTAVIGCVLNAFDTKVTNKIYTFNSPNERTRFSLIHRLQTGLFKWIRTRIFKRKHL